MDRIPPAGYEEGWRTDEDGETTVMMHWVAKEGSLIGERKPHIIGVLPTGLDPDEDEVEQVLTIRDAHRQACEWLIDAPEELRAAG